MKIVIDKIDTSRPENLGYTEMPSYPVHFRNPLFDGWARFVPARENPEAYLNEQVVVEIAHDSVSDLRILENPKHQVWPPQISALAEEFSFQVRGDVKVIVHHPKPEGNRTTYIVAGDAAFALTFSELGNLRPCEGQTVEFIAHGVSLWDEEI
jgi:hypothetical protein